MIRKFMLGRRLRAAANRSHQFMAQCDHLGEPAESSKCRYSAAPSPRPSSAQLKELLKARRARATCFGAHLVADPAWDILLLTYVAFLDQDLLLVSALLRTSFIPATTTLRWIKALEQDGWLECVDDSTEGRRSLLRLSAAGKISMERYLAAVWPSLPL